MPTNPPGAAFFSYSHEDSDFALRLAKDLKAAGANVWIDTLDITPGQRWDSAVRDALTNCPRMLAVLSPSSVDSENFLDEIAFALENRKVIVPVLYRDCAIPHRLGRVQHIDLRTDYSRGLKELLKTLEVQQPADVPKKSGTDLPSGSTLSGQSPGTEDKRESTRGRSNMDSETGTTRQTASQLKAVVFTHFGELHYGKKAGIPPHLRDFEADDAEFRRDTPRYLAKYTKIFKSYLECARDGGQVGLVYVYVDWAVRESAPTWAEGRLVYDEAFLRHDKSLLGLLREAERKARGELSVGREAPPQFERVGMTDLVHLLKNLVEVDSHLLVYLGGPGGTPFTYDSPKFAEAMIRLARGDIQHLADPIIRIDEDAKPTADFINHLLDEYSRTSSAATFFFFSGTYGNPNGQYDPINDHAVRTHWLAAVPQEAPVELTPPQTELARIFLADLSVLGATQIRDCCSHHSEVMKALLSGHPPKTDPQVLSVGHPPNRGPQVISGAGLMMSERPVNFFPPFMNFENRIVWVDDHLKRRLHEAVDDISPTDRECLIEARIQQDRHPNGLKEEDISWAKLKDYFGRLLYGCMFTRLIAQPNGEPTEYAHLLKDIAWFRVRKGDSRVSDENLERLRKRLVVPAEERYNQVVECWHSPEFGDTAIYNWVAGLDRANHRKESSKTVTDDAISYSKLLLEWPIFKHAIARLKMTDNPWLFSETR